MLTHSGCVVDVGEASVCVRVAPRPGCERCAAGNGCGGGLFARLLPSRQVTLTLPRGGRTLHPGDRVAIGLPGRSLALASLCVYGLPLAGLVGASALAWLVFGHDGAAIAGALAGLLGGALGGRALAGRSGGLDLQLLDSAPYQAL